MSWYVETLLLNRKRIRNEIDLDSDELNDLYVVETKVKNLVESKLLSAEDLKILDTICEQGAIAATATKLNMDRDILSNRFNIICWRISISLGGIFTDDGYIEYVRCKYKLTDMEVIKLERFIKSSFRHKLMQRIFEESL